MTYVSFSRYFHAQCGYVPVADLRKSVAHKIASEAGFLERIKVNQNAGIVDDFSSFEEFLDFRLLNRDTLHKQIINSIAAKACDLQKAMATNLRLNKIGETYADKLYRIRLRLRDSLDAIFKQINPDTERIKKAFHNGVRVMYCVLNSIPALMRRAGIELNKRNFIEIAKNSFKFIEDIADLDLINFSLMELFLRGVKVSASVQQSLRDLNQSSSSKTPSLLGICNIHRTIYENLESMYSFGGPTKNDQFSVDALKIQDKSVCLREPAKKQFIDYIQPFQALLDLAESKAKDLYELSNLVKYYISCPAKLIKLNVGKPNETNLFKATYDYFVRQLEGIRNLDQFLNQAA